MPDIKFQIKETIGVLSESAKGWSKELNLVSWNEVAPKYDVREWSPDHLKMGKGVNSKIDELNKLGELLNRIEL